MEITWYGHSCFRITERNRVSVVTDPFGESLGLPVPKLKADVVTVSHDVPGHNALDTIKSEPYVLRGSGEYEIGGVFINGLAMHTVPEYGEPQYNVAYHFDYDNLTVLHLGDLNHVPQQQMFEELGQVNVLLVPVGGGNSLSAAKAAEVVALIEPHYIIPMHYDLPGLAVPLDSVEKFLKAMGVSKVVEQDSLKITASDLPEQPQVIVLKPQA